MTRHPSVRIMPRREPSASWPIATALKRSIAEGYTGSHLRADLMAGAVVGVVALPLSMALAIAVGVPPQHGLYTAIIAGALVAVAGGSRYQVTGPTAAFIVILAPIVSRFGLSGLLTAGFMAGAMLLMMGLARFGRLIQFIPHPVTTGFTAGIAVVIATLQVKDAFGLSISHMPEGYVGKIHALLNAVPSAAPGDFTVAAVTFIALLFLPKLMPRLTARVPAPLIVIASVSAAAAFLGGIAPGFDVATIGSRFSSVVNGQTVAGIPQAPPALMLPWGEGGLSLEMARELLPASFAIAMLGAIESLLSAVIADGMTGHRHDPDAELVALGLGNMAVPFFGGIAATGALARTATNIRAGARSPLAAVTHSVVVLLAVLLLAPTVAYVPMAALAALLLIVAWNMSELRHFGHILRVAPKSDVFVLVTCFLLTVFFDMVLAIGVGVVLAALLFMRRMTELTSSRLIAGDNAETERRLPEGVVLYEIAGPLFFGAAQNAMGALERVDSSARVVVLSLANVPVIDATGLVGLESALERLRHARMKAVIAGPLPHPRKIFDRADLGRHHEHLTFAKDVDEALEIATRLAAAAPGEVAGLAPSVR